MNATQFNRFLAGYAVAALWSSTDDNEVPLDSNFSVSDIAPDAWRQMKDDCRKFVDQNAETLRFVEAKEDADQAGHDFWLTRNRHGVGYWDRDLGDFGGLLTEAAHGFGECNLYAENGKVGII